MNRKDVERLRRAVATRAGGEVVEVNNQPVTDSRTTVVATQQFRSRLVVHNEGPGVVYVAWGDDNLDVPGGEYSYPLLSGGRIELEQDFYSITKKKLRGACAAGDEALVHTTEWTLALPPEIRRIYNQIRSI